ncbi:uncharacterized protein LOC107304449 [Oryza brachyantha]|nr:uncharacterized protein LOC107304449 [Oryza brachyantha]XP_015694023.1 uncharacterized protein LOC107304449 [Oryza brachyantha]
MVQRSPSPSGHVVLMTTTESGQARKTVSFRTTEAMREDIFVIAEVEGGYRGFNMLTGTIISPSCKSKDPQSGEVILGSEHRFALSCAAANIIGAAVFDFNCLLVGTVSEFDDVSYDLNYALQSCHWVKQLEESLKAVNSKISLSKDMKINILETRKRKRNISKA